MLRPAQAAGGDSPPTAVTPKAVSAELCQLLPGGSDFNSPTGKCTSKFIATGLSQPFQPLVSRHRVCSRKLEPHSMKWKHLIVYTALWEQLGFLKEYLQCILKIKSGLRLNNTEVIRMELNSVGFGNRCKCLLTFSLGQIRKRTHFAFLATDPNVKNAMPGECPTASGVALCCLILVHSSQCHWQRASHSDHSCRCWARERWLLSVLINRSLWNCFLLDFPISMLSCISKGISNMHRNAGQGCIGLQLVP
ncbi:uncharacterized protein LOC127384982 isoform X2 [Apus apus]|uniref:uncharacterized protein LOC127384982 isoform X2 n=1 Tax=Apus apus TaxID=8895 RepID=UPI0021F82625|nr:uncharacterized protein LOC127384982 isoform X2 [Apus apus]